MSADNEMIPGGDLITVGIEDIGVLVVAGYDHPCLILQLLGYRFVMTDVTALVVARAVAEVATCLISGALVPPGHGQKPDEADAPPTGSRMN